MKIRKNLKTKAALKGITIFAVMALTPIALLFAGSTPLGQTHSLTKHERSQKEWRSMKNEVQLILNKADKLSEYKVIK